MVEPIYPAGLPPRIWPAFDSPSQYPRQVLTEVAICLGIENADQLKRTQLLHQIVAWKIDYKEKS